MRAGQQGSPGVFFHRPVSTTVWITTTNLRRRLLVVGRVDLLIGNQIPLTRLSTGTFEMLDLRIRSPFQDPWHIR